LHGRFWTDQEEREQTPVVIISRELSQKLLGRDNGVGADIRIGSSNFRVIGISDRWAPRPRAHFLTPENPGWQGDGDQLFAPALPMLDARVNLLSNRECDSGGYGGMRFNEIDIGECRWLAMWAELETAQQRESYRDILQDYARERHASGAFARTPNSQLYNMSEWLRINQVVPDSVRLNLWLALGLLTLCLVNVAGLLAARFLRRGAELGVRRVLGASRGAIIGSCLVESGLAGLLGGLLALPLTLGGLWLIRQQGQDYASLAHFSTPLFAVLLALSLAIGLLVGLLPALRATRQQPALQVKTL
jgi:putative ABC transport system permease protein